ncbi:hypothetical protein BC830DRAFT_631002 [Chytriomyces sp. MP71]|nr:hypothetical protein BC830DRAFT_631002 [Chytriomyces sp. MP71]
MSAAASTDVLDTSTVLLKTLSYAVGGMTIECAARSILSASLKLYQGPFPTGSAKPAATCLNLVLILVGSSLSLILSLMTIGTSFISINVCIAMSFSANLSWHLFFVIFAAFLMYKTWHVCNGNSVYTALAVLLFMCRISFGFADLGFSGGIIIEDTCNYKQSEVTGIGYAARIGT